MMDYNSVLKGLDEAIKISNGKMKGRRRKVRISPVQEFSKDEIKTIRQHLHLTQGAFAEVIGVTSKTVEAWGKGDQHTYRTGSSNDVHIKRRS